MHLRRWLYRGISLCTAGLTCMDSACTPSSFPSLPLVCSSPVVDATVEINKKISQPIKLCSITVTAAVMACACDCY